MDRKIDIAKKYRDTYGYEIPTRRLADIMFRESGRFNNFEDARDFLRYIEGKKGEKQRKNRN